MTSTGSALDIVFRGTDGTEAEEFIAAIEELAFTEGWSRDRERMLLFARSRLRHKALRWFARLDPSKKNDWDLFVEALFDQYSLVEAPTEAEISTPVWSATTFSPGATTAGLPSDQVLDPHPRTQDERQVPGSNIRHSFLSYGRSYDPSILGRHVGLLRIVIEDGTTGPQYIWRGRPPTYSMPYGYTKSTKYEPLSVTVDRQEALVVCFIPSAEPHPIGCLNDVYKLGDLSLYFNALGVDTYEFCVFNGAYTIDKIGASSGYPSNVWNLLSDGSLEASLYALDPSSLDRSTGQYTRREDFKTSEILVDIAGTSVRFVKPGTLLRQDDPKRKAQGGRHEFRARIVFEPL